MRKIILGMFILSSQLSFAQNTTDWSNPNVCDPSNVRECWIKCYNRKSVLEGERLIEVYITPQKDGEMASKVIVNQQRLLISEMNTVIRGKIVRNDLTPLTFQYVLDGKTLLHASIDPTRIVPNNGWMLKGELKYARRSYEMFCFYETKLWMETYESVYRSSFPHEFFDDFYH
jgi:hypothetical protein